MTTKHSPTPWRIDADVNADETAIVCSREGGDIVALSPGIEGWELSAELWPANAAHIVKCVNLHDELVAALREVVESYDFYSDRRVSESQGGFDKARALLLKVTP
jgi:hypothetical protein